MGLEASELARWTRFAAKGGIGKCTATCDCVAKSKDDLMFLKDDEITVLLQLPDKGNIFLGYCEGVVGHFFGSDVHFHAKLKVPVKAKRASIASRKSPPPPSDNASPIGHTHVLPLDLAPESTTPLRINKRPPTSPPPQFSPNSSHSVSQTPPSSSVPDTYATHDERSKRQSALMSDAQVGIGLSLLQDFANGMDSDSDNDDDQRPKPDQHSAAAPSAASVGEWEGASDIYDDYRYSRYSIASKMSRFSSSTGWTGSVPPTTPPLPESNSIGQARTDSNKSRPQSSGFDEPSSARSDLHTPIVGGGVRSPFGFTEEGAGKETSDIMTTGGFSHGVNGGGIASAMRQRLETERQSPMPEQTQNPQLSRNTSMRKSFIQSDGLGHRIVVEDDDELPSGILDDSDSTFMTTSPEPTYDEDEESDSNEGRRRSDANDGGHDRRSRTTDEVEDEEEEQEPEAATSTIIPTAPPLNASSPSPTPQASTLVSPALPRLSSTSTIRMDSPPIELRPPLALSDIREARGPFVPGSNQRRSLFLPHPNAPKSPIGDVSFPGLAGPGPGVPMYIAVQQQEWARGPGGMIPPVPNVVGVIRMALRTPPSFAIPHGQGPPGQRSPLMIPMRGPTIYGRTETDLSGSLVPVPIAFSIDPPHVTAPQPSSNPNPPSLAPPPQSTPTAPSTNPNPPSLVPPLQGTLKAHSSSNPNTPTSQGTPTSVPSPTQVIKKQQQQHPLRRLSLGSGAEAGAAVVSAAEGDVTAADTKATGGLIPRPNFSPKSPGLRPRSRSLSSFNSTDTGVPQRSGVEGEISPSGDVKRSLTTSVSSSSPLSASSSSGPSKSKLASIGLSPLSLPPNNLRVSALRSPNSPLAQSIVPSKPASPNQSSVGRLQHQLRRETSSKLALNETSPSPSHSIPIPRPTVHGTTTGSTGSPPTPLSPPQSLGHTTPIQAQSKNDTSSRTSDADAVSINSDTRYPTRKLSVRTKLSLPNLRRHRSRPDDESGGDGDMLQVKDTEFQLVTPNFAHFQSRRPSEDSGVLTKDGDVRQDGNGFLRTESPAISMLSGGSKQSPMNELPVVSPWTPHSATTPNSRATTESESFMDAHRHREIKWMSLMSSSPAFQARKTKKVRKLLMDGVPSSVRYLVWSYLTDGKARCVPGVYAQLCSRGRVPWSADIERDIKSCFRDQPHLQGTQGPVLLLLQAYLNMVPDILYTKGLTLIVGQLLLLAPEEDAFWIFVSIMDTHIRPYFSTVTTQMEVDSALFSRALESNDNQVAKKILVDMGITPPTICQPWFSSLFVGTLHPEYLNRIWDLFLFEGIPFLIRVALAIVTCCRSVILESSKEETVLEIFQHPPQSLLPASPDAFLLLVCSVKLKDDDVRKQRIKMEAQVKRQTQVPRTGSSVGSISLPRT